MEMATKQPSTNMQPVGDAPIVIESYSDVEDIINEIHDELWRVADYVSAIEPLQAKQQFEKVKDMFTALETHIQNMPEKKDTEEA